MFAEICKTDRNNELGRRIGSFKGYAHGVRGTVYAVDDSTLYIHGFYYDAIDSGSCLKFN